LVFEQEPVHSGAELIAHISNTVHIVHLTLCDELCKLIPSFISLEQYA
jgi:hypothetical protein